VRPEGREEERSTAARVDRTTMVAPLDGLARQGLVARRPDVEDRRRNVVELTDAGRSTLDVAPASSDESERQLLACPSAPTRSVTSSARPAPPGDLQPCGAGASPLRKHHTMASDRRVTPILR